MSSISVNSATSILATFLIYLNFREHLLSIHTVLSPLCVSSPACSFRAAIHPWLLSSEGIRFLYLDQEHLNSCFGGMRETLCFLQRKLEQRRSGHKPCLSNPVVRSHEISSSSLVDDAPVREISCWSLVPEWETVHLSLRHSWTSICPKAKSQLLPGLEAAISAQHAAPLFSTRTNNHRLRLEAECFLSSTHPV